MRKKQLTVHLTVTALDESDDYSIADWQEYLHWEFNMTKVSVNDLAIDPSSVTVTRVEIERVETS